jgi:TonB family protein
LGIGRHAEADRNLGRAFLISVGAHLLLIGVYLLVASGAGTTEILRDGSLGRDPIIPVNLDRFLHRTAPAGATESGDRSLRGNSMPASTAPSTGEQRAGTIPIPTTDSVDPAEIGGSIALRDIAGAFPPSVRPERIDGPVGEAARPRTDALPSEEEIFDGTEPQVDLDALQHRVVYPEIASRNGIEGRVIVKVLVDEKGQASRPRVEYSDSRLLDAAAIEAILRTRFVPGNRGGAAVPVWMTIPLEFRLK